MNKRDLKADLEELHSLMQSADDWENMQNFLRAFGDEWLNQALAEKERADRSEALARELVEALKKAHEYIGDINSFYGQGLQVHEWHLNGTPEPLDNFIDSNGGCEAEEFVGRVLTKAREVLGDEA